jgi:hypothetical protein
MVRIIPYDPIAKLLISAAAGYTVLSLLLKEARGKISFFPINGKAGIVCYIGNQPFQAIMDSGADINSVNEETAEHLGITKFSRLAKKEPYKNAGSTSYTPFKTLGGHLVPLTLGGLTINTEVWVTNSNEPPLITPGAFLSIADIMFSDFSMTLLDKDSYHEGTFQKYFIFEDERLLARRPIFKLNIGGSLATCLVDSGAPNSYVSKNIAKRIRIERFPEPMPGIYLLTVKIGPIEYMTTFKPYPGELVILSCIEFMKKGYSMTMTDSGAYFN